MKSNILKIKLNNIFLTGNVVMCGLHIIRHSSVHEIVT